MIRHCIALLMLLLYAGAVCAAERDILSVVDSSARSWLALTDEGQYAESWKKASAHFQKKRSEADWIKTAGTIRKPLGSMEARYIATASQAKELSDFPKGEYVVIQFYTTFTSRGLALETITLAREKDGTWRVADYVIK